MTGGDLDALREENRKLRKINAALMRRVEHSMDAAGDGYSLFQTAIALEAEVRKRTADLARTLSGVEETNARLREASEAAERARLNLANAIAAVQEGFALFGADDRLVMCNEPFRRLFASASPSIRPGLAFADYARLAANSAELDLGEIGAPEGWIAMRMRVHGGAHETFVQPLKGDRWMQISERRTPDGGAVIFQTDITDLVRWERRETDKRLDEQARLVRATLDHMTQGVCVFDESLTLVAWNERFRTLMGLPFSLLVEGVSFGRIAGYVERNTLIASPEAAQALVEWVNARRDRTPLAIEMRRSDGMALDVRGNMMPDGGFVAAITDVTAERRAAEALRDAARTLEQRVAERTAELSEANSALVAARDAAEAADQSKTRFLAAASHDLLQPLNAARLFLSALAETPLNAAQTSLTQRLESAFVSTETLLGALLDISKLDAGAGGVSCARLPMSAILAPIANEFRPIAEQAGLRFRVAPCSALVLSNADYLRRIVQNLVSNAIRYTPAGGVLVGCRRRGDQLSIEVWDTGVGIADDKRAAVFQEFTRIDAAPRRGERGMGLGLAIVERACRLLDHTVTLRSEPGKGSVFAVCAPFAGYAAPSAPTPPRPAAAHVEGDLIALVIENEATIRAAMIDLFALWGVAAVGAGSIAEAAAAIDDLGMAPDILAVDYHLDDGETGVEAIRRLRLRCEAEIPAVIITADRSEATAAAAAACRAELLTKPVRPEKLRDALARIVAPAPR